MDIMEFLRTRRTYRRFEQRPVAPEILQECVDAARIASCGANRQTVKYIIVQSPEAVAAVQPLVHWAAYLPREQGTPKADEVPTAFIAVLQDENLPGANDMDAGLALGSLTALSVALISVVAPLIVYMVVPGSFGEWLSTLIPAGGIGLSNALLYKMISFDFLYAGGHAFFQADVLLASAPIKIVLLVGLAAWGYLRKTKVA